MARYRDAKCRLCRREGMKLFLKGSRCFTDKCAIERRGYAPGEHGKNRRVKETNYGTQMLERRLDNVVFRLGFAPSRSASRQLVRHGHVTVNGKRVDIPSVQVRAGD